MHCFVCFTSAKKAPFHCCILMSPFETTCRTLYEYSIHSACVEHGAQHFWVSGDLPQAQASQLYQSSRALREMAGVAQLQRMNFRESIRHLTSSIPK
mmetsp:Transcript_16518/g.47544  ORF Transcript_16518/g.47544 Transcript_16518/m.47544 type:complete len:97 (+) Transcript_16518:242-532(+)